VPSILDIHWYDTKGVHHQCKEVPTAWQTKNIPSIPSNTKKPPLLYQHLQNGQNIYTSKPLTDSAEIGLLTQL
jgi:hypothetical protein